MKNRLAGLCHHLCFFSLLSSSLPPQTPRQYEARFKSRSRSKTGSPQRKAVSRSRPGPGGELRRLAKEHLHEKQCVVACSCRSRSGPRKGKGKGKGKGNVKNDFELQMRILQAGELLRIFCDSV